MRILFSNASTFIFEYFINDLVQMIILEFITTTCCISITLLFFSNVDNFPIRGVLVLVLLQVCYLLPWLPSAIFVDGNEFHLSCNDIFFGYRHKFFLLDIMLTCMCLSTCVCVCVCLVSIYNIDTHSSLKTSL